MFQKTKQNDDCLLDFTSSVVISFSEKLIILDDEKLRWWIIRFGALQRPRNRPLGPECFAGSTLLGPISPQSFSV